jgi:hypothetical protein
MVDPERDGVEIEAKLLILAVGARDSKFLAHSSHSGSAPNVNVF